MEQAQPSAENKTDSPSKDQHEDAIPSSSPSPSDQKPTDAVSTDGTEENGGKGVENDDNIDKEAKAKKKKKKDKEGGKSKKKQASEEDSGKNKETPTKVEKKDVEENQKDSFQAMCLSLDSVFKTGIL
jgi:hypothetical protein